MRKVSAPAVAVMSFAPVGSVTFAAFWKELTDVATNTYDTCAIRTDAHITCWGGANFDLAKVPWGTYTDTTLVGYGLGTVTLIST